MSPVSDPLLRPKFSPLCEFDIQISREHSAERFLVLQQGALFYLRLRGHPDWLAIIESDGRLQWLSDHQDDGETLCAYIHQKATHREWGRVLSLADPRGKDELWRITWKGARSFLMRPSTGEAVEFRSSDDWKRGAWIQPGAHFIKRFGREWRNPNSDVRQAHNFLEADTEARYLWGLDWVQGSWTEMKSILRAATIIEHEWSERTVVQARPIYPSYMHPVGFNSNAPQSGRLLRLIGKLEESNVALLRDKRKLRQFALQPFRFTAATQRWPELRIEVDPPSEHEKIEARLELRDWMRIHAPDLLSEWES